jgi:hypothetical protein
VTGGSEAQVRLSFEDAEAMWASWSPADDDLLARAAFERTLHWALELDEEGLYFRPGGWVVELPQTAVRVACAAAILAAGFHIAGLDDLDREVIIAAAGLVATMNVRPIRVTSDDRVLVERVRDRQLADTPISAKQARRALPRRMRKTVTTDEIEQALDRLVAAGIADREGDGEYVVRGDGSEAWLRVSLGDRRKLD